jgi:hypothetical protein
MEGYERGSNTKSRSNQVILEGRWDRHASGHRQVVESVEILAVVAEVLADSIADLDTPPVR